MKAVLFFTFLLLATAYAQCNDWDISVNTTYSQSSSGVCDANNNFTCPTGQCCSVDGFCGSTDDFCSPLNNCINQCWSCGSINPLTNQSYGCPDAQCCSQYGYCGVTAAYCQTGSPNYCNGSCAYSSPPSISYGITGLTVGSISFVNITGDSTLNFTACPVQLKFFNNTNGDNHMVQSFWFNTDPTINSLYNLYTLQFSLNYAMSYYLRLNCTCSPSWCSYSNKIGPFTVGPASNKRQVEDRLSPYTTAKRDKRQVGNWNPNWKNVIYVYQLVSQGSLARSIIVPGVAGTFAHNYNVVVLAFWLSSTYSPDPYSACGYWSRLNQGTQQAYIRAFHNAGMRVIVSAFGGGDNPTTKSASTVASKIASFVINNNLDGVDIDYEAPAHPGNNQYCGNCFSASWVVSLQQNLRKALPKGQYIITHAPQSPHFSTQTGSDFPDNAYVNVHQNVGNTIDWYNIQYYNNENKPTCSDLFNSHSGYGPGTAVFELMKNLNMPSSQIVVGKPVGTPSHHDGNGFMSATTLASCFQNARKNGYNGQKWTSGGASGWELYFDSSSVRWSQTIYNGLNY